MGYLKVTKKGHPIMPGGRPLFLDDQCGVQGALERGGIEGPILTIRVPYELVFHITDAGIEMPAGIGFRILGGLVLLSPDFSVKLDEVVQLLEANSSALESERLARTTVDEALRIAREEAEAARQELHQLAMQHEALLGRLKHAEATLAQPQKLATPVKHKAAKKPPAKKPAKAKTKKPPAKPAKKAAMTPREIQRLSAQVLKAMGL